jgi:hypothetical protein
MAAESNAITVGDVLQTAGEPWELNESTCLTIAWLAANGRMMWVTAPLC